MKTTILAVAVAVLAPAANGFAYTPCATIVAPQPAKATVLSKKAYTPVVTAIETASSVKPTFGRRPVVKQAANSLKATEITVGATVTAPARFLGNEVGCVFLQVGPAMLECEVVEWSPTSVTFVVPNMGLGPITAGRLQIVRGDGDLIRDYPVRLIRKPDLIVHKEPTPVGARRHRQSVRRAQRDVERPAHFSRPRAAGASAAVGMSG